MRTLYDGTLQFAVRFEPRAPATSDLPGNNCGLAGHGTVEVQAAAVTFTEIRGGAAFKGRGLALDQIANVEHAAGDTLVVVRDRKERTFVSVWAQTPEEAAQLVALLPRDITPAFAAHREVEKDFERRTAALSPRQRVTPVLIALNVIVFALLAFAGAGIVTADPNVNIRFGSNLGLFTWDGEPWRLLTSAFMHFGIVHLAFNMVALHYGGRLTERLYGGARFLVLYLLSALAGSVVSGWWDPTRNAVGASGAVFGVFGALLVFFAMRRGDVPARLFTSAGKGALLLCGYSLLVGANDPKIDNAAHIGGLLAGALAGLLLARPFQVEARAKPKPGRIAGVAAGICAALVALSIPLWWSGSARAAEMDAARVMYHFARTEGPLVDRLVIILKSTSGTEVSDRDAATRIESEVFEAWRAAAAKVLSLAPLQRADTTTARRLRLMKRYIAARDRATQMTIDALGRRARHGEAAINRAWNRVNDLVAQMQEVH